MRIEQLTFTRFIAALFIVIFHFGHNNWIFNNNYVDFFFKQANIFVSYFFILSGFIMIIAYKNIQFLSFFQYIKHRIARVYPVYLLALFLTIVLVYSDKSILYQDVILNFFMLQSWFPDKALSINFPGWSISVELLFYLVFPILLNYVYNKTKFKYLAISLLSFWLFSQILIHILLPKLPFYLFGFSSLDLYYLPLLHLNEFVIGNLCALFLLNKTRVHKNYDLHIMVLVLILLLILKYPMNQINHNGILAVIFVPLIFFMSLNNGLITKVFKLKLFIFLGEISFGLYILQYPIWQIFTDYRMIKYFSIDVNKDATLAFFIKLVVLIIISSLCYYFFEKPMRKKINKIKLS